jgi:hypothetical protein
MPPVCGWGRRLDAVYLGDLIGAQAIRSLANNTGGFSFGIIDGLLSIEPQEKLVERALIALARPDGQLVHIKVENGKAWLADRHGEVHGEEIECLLVIIGATPEDEKERSLADRGGDNATMSDGRPAEGGPHRAEAPTAYPAPSPSPHGGGGGNSPCSNAIAFTD